MSVLTIELDPETRPHTCGHCGSESIHIKGYVYDDGNAYAIYHAAIYPTHGDRKFALDVSMGGWDEHAGPERRMRVAILVWPQEADIHMSIHDREKWNWADSKEFGVVLSRDEALRLSSLPDFYRVAEFVT